MIEFMYTERCFILQLFSFFRIEMGFGTTETAYFTYLSLGIWQFDVSFGIEKDNNAHDIQNKWDQA